MASPNSSHRMNWYETLMFLTAVGLPIAAFLFHSKIPPMGKPMEVTRMVTKVDPSILQFVHQSAGAKPKFGQQYTQVSLQPTGSGNRYNVIAADARLGQVVSFQRGENVSQWNATVLCQNLGAPVRVVQVDLDSDGDIDLVVSCAGSLSTSDKMLGRVVWLENEGGRYQEARTILDNVRRVADAQFGDFDSDGDLDAVVAVVGGVVQGQILVLENNGEQKFTEYEMMSISGAISVPVRDFNGDGDLDFAAVVSNQDQQIWLFENDGNGFNHNRRHLTFSSTNFDLGLSAMIAEDLDQDGDQDLVFTKGGSKFDNREGYPKHWHGVQWLENKGEFVFESKEIATIAGASDVASADLDGDGDLDLAVVSQFNDWMAKEVSSVFWLENDGQQNFRPWKVADAPIKVSTVVCGDIDGNGTVDIVTGCVHTARPFEKFGSVDFFLNQKTPTSASFLEQNDTMARREVAQ